MTLCTPSLLYDAAGPHETGPAPVDGCRRALSGLPYLPHLPARRSRRQPGVGFRIVERLNIGIIAGASLGIVVHFLANRLLPLDIAHPARSRSALDESLRMIHPQIFVLAPALLGAPAGALILPLSGTPS